ncbi:MAG TPA: hypothetical protein VFD70_24930 [Anaerolineae bacterium]|nr:hypothetical protein [Anaerolineae bacterium]
MLKLTNNVHGWSFTPTKWSSAANKHKFALHYISFIQARCPFEKFHEWFYTRLSQMFMHIAHYNRHGFYEVWCDTPEKRLALLRHHLRYPSVGDPVWTWSDVERELQIWLAESGILRAYEFEAQTETRHHLTATIRAALTELPDEVVVRLVQERLAPHSTTPNDGNEFSPPNRDGAITPTLHPSGATRSEQQMLFEV